jgi:2-methylcitrate dehydratase
MHDVLTAMIKAYEIQGCLALLNSLNRRGLDHVMFVKIASTAVSAQLLGLDKDGLMRAISQACVDGQSLRTYRHAPNAGSRKSWAAGDATARAVRLALITQTGEMGYPSALSAPKWGFYDVLFAGKAFEFQRPYGTYVMEHVLFKLSYPAEFHAQTAVECAVKLHPLVKNRLNDIIHIHLTTHESAIRIISKHGALHNPADRDHCLQYMVAVALLTGDLQAENYEDQFASDSRIDALRVKMQVEESVNFSKDYHDKDKRSIANSIQITFRDGSKTDRITVEYPLGHRRRRAEGIPFLLKKFEQNVRTHFDEHKTQTLIQAMSDALGLSKQTVPEFMNMWQS